VSRTFRAALLVAALGAAVLAGGVRAQGRRGAAPTPPAAPADPVRAAFEAATAPGLADSTRVRLETFLARHARHPLARGAQHELGLLAYARGEYADARDRFRRARPAAGGDEARYWEAQALFALGKTREARALALPLARVPAKRAGPRRFDAACLVALSWLEEGRKPEALAAWREVFAMPAGAGEAAALYQGVLLARELGRNDDAATWRTRLLARAPKSPEAASLVADAGAPDSAKTKRR